MSEALHDFLIDLAVNPDRMGQFLRDPAAEIARAHLTLEETDAILSRDRLRIRAVLGASMLAITDDEQDFRPPPKHRPGDKKPGYTKRTPKRKPTKKKTPKGRPKRKK